MDTSLVKHNEETGVESSASGCDWVRWWAAIFFELEACCIDRRYDMFYFVRDVNVLTNEIDYRVSYRRGTLFKLFECWYGRSSWQGLSATVGNYTLWLLNLACITSRQSELVYADPFCFPISLEHTMTVPQRSVGCLTGLRQCSFRFLRWERFYARSISFQWRSFPIFVRKLLRKMRVFRYIFCWELFVHTLTSRFSLSWTVWRFSLWGRSCYYTLVWDWLLCFVVPELIPELFENGKLKLVYVTTPMGQKLQDCGGTCIDGNDDVSRIYVY